MDATSISAPGSAKGLVKGIALVDIVAASVKPLRQVDLVEASGLPRPTAVRLLESLVELDVLRIESRGLYELGPRVAAWGQAFLDGLDLTRQAFDIIENLVERSNETSYLGVLDRRSVLYISAVNSPQPVRPAARVGARNPLHCTGIGKAILAFRTPEERAELLGDGELERRTANTITDRAALSAELDAIAARGFSIDEIENEEGVRCVAAPVRDHLGDVVAAISVSAPAYRFSHEHVVELAPAVMAATAELSARLGYPGEGPAASSGLDHAHPAALAATKGDTDD
jgi:IclR family acetate operon transcriptional repressor